MNHSLAGVWGGCSLVLVTLLRCEHKGRRAQHYGYRAVVLVVRDENYEAEMQTQEGHSAAPALALGGGGGGSA
jgi:hypothetical protein